MGLPRTVQYNKVLFIKVKFDYIFDISVQNIKLYYNVEKIDLLSKSKVQYITVQRKGNNYIPYSMVCYRRY